MLDDVPLTETCLCCRDNSVCRGIYPSGQTENTKDTCKGLFYYLFHNQM